MENINKRCFKIICIFVRSLKIILISAHREMSSQAQVVVWNVHTEQETPVGGGNKARAGTTRGRPACALKKMESF